MAKPTYNTIAHGQQSWDADLDANFDILESQAIPIPAYADKAALPAAGNYDECIAITQDTNDIWTSDGTSWFKLGRGLDKLKCYPQACGFIADSSPDDGKQTARSYSHFGVFFVRGFQNFSSDPGDPGDEALITGGGGGMTAYIVMGTLNDSTGANAPNFDLMLPFPEQFNEWGPDGIRWWTRGLSHATGTGPNLEPSIEIFDPADGTSFSTPRTASRAVAASAFPETDYGATQLTKATLDNELSSFQAAAAAGDEILKLRLTLDVASAGDGELVLFHLGLLEIDWR